MTETVIGESGGTDDWIQLLTFIGSSIWLIILKNAAFIWNIIAVLVLLIAWKYFKWQRKGHSRPSKKHSKDQDDSEDEDEPKVHHSRGRSPRHSNRD